MSNLFARCSCGGLRIGQHAPDCREDPRKRPMLCGETRGSTRHGTFLACDLPLGHPPPCASGGVHWSQP